MPEQKSAFDTPWFINQSNEFFNHLNKTKIPHIVLTAETEDFDDETIQQFKDEGFDVAYVPLLNGGNDFVARVHRTGDGFGVGEYYGIVAFGDAAAVMLEAHRSPNHPKLVAVVAYYPSAIPSVHTKFPLGTKILVHLAGSEVGVTSTTQALGIQGKRKTVRKRIDPGEGHGGTLKLAYPAYTYHGSQSGFAEHDLDEYDPVAESIAFTRSLATLRKAFRIDSTVELARDEFVNATFKGQHDKTQKALRDYGHVIHGPTLTGGIGNKDISRFYSTDRVVDELYINFEHSVQIPWMLPGLPPTNKRVEIVIVSIMCVRGGKLESEHIYWDQASVLAQIGLLNPKAVPGQMRKKGVKELPVIGAEGARAMKRGSTLEINRLIPEWQ